MQKEKQLPFTTRNIEQHQTNRNTPSFAENIVALYFDVITTALK